MALYDFTHQKVTDEIDTMLDDQFFPVTAIIELVNLGGTVDNVKKYFASVVANQSCNTFASDYVADLTPTWQGTTDGEAVNPDDTSVNWDVASVPSVMPASLGSHRVQVYGTSLPVVIDNCLNVS